MRSLLSLGLMMLASAGKIKHVVVLMEENRSFDHMFGFYTAGKVNGLTGKEFNPYNTSLPSGPGLTVGKTSPYIAPWDPNHGLPVTTQKIYGNDCIKRGCTTPTMDGFAEYEHAHHPDATSVMNMFTPDRLPIISTLAENFVLFDRYFCAVPGPTWPNRLFQLLGTSEGCTSTSAYNPNTHMYYGKTVFQQIEEVGLDWRHYYYDAPGEVPYIAYFSQHPQKVLNWARWKQDIKAGNLPAFSWINPRWFVNVTSGEGSSDQHPDHDVRLGEALMKEIYEDIRASPAWNDTLFIITYDEHGGFYDHVTPPTGIPAPDGSTSFPDKFDFTRGGIRIPTLAISPWVPKGWVEGKANGPRPNSEYETTSIIATMGKLFNFTSPPLTPRVAWAGTFEHILSEPRPRTDCPLKLPNAPKSLGRSHALQEAALPLNDLQKEIVSAWRQLRGLDAELSQEDKLPTLQGQASEWVSAIVKEVLEGNHILAARQKEESS